MLSPSASHTESGAVFPKTTATPSTPVAVVSPKLFDTRPLTYPSSHNGGRRFSGALRYWLLASRLVRVTVVRVTETGLGFFLFRLLDDEGLGGQQHRGDRRGILKSRPSDLDRVDNAGGDQITVLTG